MLINSYRFRKIIDVIQTGATATSSAYGNFSYIRKASAASTTATLLSYVSIGNFSGPEPFSLPLLIFTSSNIFLHPGGTSAAVGIRWTAPTTGTVSVTGRFVKDNTTGASNGVNVSVYKNNTTAVVAPSLINSSNSIFQYTDVQTTVSAGNTLDFVIDNNGDFGSDHTNCTLLTIELA